MEYTCGNCGNLDLNSKNYWGEYYCKVIGKYVALNHSKCSAFTKNNDTREKESGEYTPAGCMMTTLCVTILGMADDCESMQAFRELRESYLKQDQNLHYILLNYDKYSPLISAKLLEDYKKDKEASIAFAKDLKRRYLDYAATCIYSGKYEQATLVLTTLLSILKSKYNLEEIPENPDKNIPIEELGKGRARVRTV